MAYRLQNLKVCLLKNDPPFLLQIYPKLCYFIHKYSCLWEKLAKNTCACERTATGVRRSKGVNISDLPLIFAPNFFISFTNMHVFCLKGQVISEKLAKNSYTVGALYSPQI